jgi:1-acyl-sn-glycerol-3-phosphate acyltransferase
MDNSAEALPIGTRVLLGLRVALWFVYSAVHLLVIIATILVARDSRYWYPLARRWATASLRWFRIEVRAVGVDNLVAGRDYVILANHRSHFDIFAIIATLADSETLWVAKRELTRVPIFGYGLKVSGQILIDRHDHEQALRELRANLGKRGATVVFFAEGQRSPSMQLLPFKKGGAAFAIDAGLPVVPVALSGSERVLAKHTLLVRPGTIRVAIGEPIDTRAMTPDDRVSLTVRARDAVGSMLSTMEQAAPLRSEAAAGEMSARV